MLFRENYIDNKKIKKLINKILKIRKKENSNEHNFL